MADPDIHIERILFPTDFSPFSAEALRHALAMAQKYRARIKVVHVIPHVIPGGDSVYFAAPWLMAPEVRQQVDEQMRLFLLPARDARIDYEVEVTEGDPWREILEAAEALPADLVVMGTHGRGGLDHLFLGSVAEKLVRRLSCPVLTVSHEEGRTWQAPGVLDRILCATDFSETSAAALKFTVALARTQASPAEVVLLHVMENLPDFGDPAFRGLPEVEPILQEVERKVHERLQGLLNDAEALGVKVEPKVVAGRAYKEILKAAAQWPPDLIVIGAQGHGPLEHMISGSNAQHVIRRATCPVLTVRPPRARPRGDPAKPSGLVLAPPKN